jgi:ABC-2 type transport system permease protein
MKTFKYYLKIAFLLFAQDLKGQMQFRSDFWFSQLAMILSAATWYFSFWALFHAIPSLVGWNFHELTFVFAISVSAFALQDIFCTRLWSLSQELIEGTFITNYFKPLNMLFGFLSGRFGFFSFSRLLFGLVTLVYSIIKLKLHLSIFKIALLVLSIISASLVMNSLMLVTACMAFWTLSNALVLHFTMRFGDYAKYPITIFNRFFRFLFTYIVPIGFVAFYPAQLFLRPEKANLLVYLSPGIGIVCFLLAYQVWRIGVNSYSGTGT